MEKKTKRLVFILIAAAVVTASAVVARHVFVGETKHGAPAKSVYYCPMHPTYTSGRPGDCPICNMKLVKRETLEPDKARPAREIKKDICYLHSCPHLKEGSPCPMLVVGKEGEKVTCPICGTHISEDKKGLAKAKILYWTDPMLSGYKSDKPGKSPMGMDLIPVYEEEAPGPASTTQTPGGYASIWVTPQKQQLIGVKTAPVQKKPITKIIRTVGRIAYDPELYQAQEEYIQAIQASGKTEATAIPEIKEQASKLVDSAKIRLKLMGLGEELVKEIEASGKPDRSLLYSEAGGKVWLYVPIYEYEIPLVKIGDSIDVEVPAVPWKKFQGTIRSIDSVLDSTTRTARVRAVLDNSEGLLKPEMYVNASLQIDLGEVLAVPNEAVFQTGEKNIVFVSKADGLFEPREVSLGVKSEGFQEIKIGLSEGEAVVTSGNFLIDSESRLKAALEGIGSGGGHPHGG